MKNCARCGLVEVPKGRKYCSECSLARGNERAREWRERHVEKSRAATRKYQSRKRREEPEKIAWAKAKSSYKISREDYENLLKRADGKCEICMKVMTRAGGHQPVIDHSHATGKVRGVICAKCNSALGFVEDDVQRLQRMEKYLASRVDVSALASEELPNE